MRALACRSVLHTVVATAVTLIAVSCFCAAAEATPYNVTACDLSEPAHYPSGEWAGSSRVGFKAISDCPRELRFEQTETVADGTAPFFSIIALSPITALSFTIDGGDTSNGVEYTVRSSNQDVVLRLPDRLPGDEPIPISVVLPRPTTVYIYAKCAAATCPPADGLKLRDFRFTLVDQTPPRVEGPWSMWPAEVEGGYRWKSRRELTTAIAGNDTQTGLRVVWFQVDGQVGWRWPGICQPGIDWTIAIGCTVTMPTQVVNLDGAFIGDGWHDVSVWARDGAGNTYQSPVVRMGVDRVPPSRPVTVTAEDLNSHGWSSNRLHRLSWTTTGEKVETETESGVDWSVIGMTPLDGDPEFVSYQYVPGDRVDDLTLPADGRWLVSVAQVDNAGNYGPARTVLLSQDVDVPDAPTILPLEWVSRAQLIAGIEQAWEGPAVTSSLESGLCGYSIEFGNDEMPDATPNVTWPTSLARVPANLHEGSNPVRVRSVTCAGRGSPVATGTIDVDSIPPAIGISGVPQESWSAAPVTVTASALDEGSGVAGMTSTVDGGAPTEIAGAQAAERLRDGVHTLRFSAIDRAGNRSNDSASIVRVDTVAPSLNFDSPNPNDPTLVRGTAADTTSGIAEAHLEYSRVDAGATASEGIGHRFGRSLEPATDDKSVALEARLPEDDLPDGEYALRIVARDKAGNVAVAAPASPAHERTVTLPLRERLALSAQLARYVKRCGRKRAKCKPKSVIDLSNAGRELVTRFGERSVLAGELRHANGDPLAGAPLKIFARRKFGGPALLAETETAADGSYALRLAPAQTRTITVEFAGNATARRTTAHATSWVRGSAKLSVSPRHARGGRMLTFSGRLASGGATLPTAGKNIQFQFLSGDKWTPTIASMKTDLQGRFKATYRITRNVRRRTTVKFRVALPTEDNWPYEEGSSNSVKVVVLP